MRANKCPAIAQPSPEKLTGGASNLIGDGEGLPTRHAGPQGAGSQANQCPSQFVQRVWTSLLLIVPIGGLVVLGYSLQQYFVR
jgi:hypothetical protein